MGEDLLLPGVVEVLEDVDRVVGFELANAVDHRLGRQFLENLDADGLVELGERGEVEVTAEQLDQLRPVGGRQCLQQAGEVAFVQVGDKRLERLDIARLDGAERRLDEAGRLGRIRVVFRPARRGSEIGLFAHATLQRKVRGGKVGGSRNESPCCF